MPGGGKFRRRGFRQQTGEVTQPFIRAVPFRRFQKIGDARFYRLGNFLAGRLEAIAFGQRAGLDMKQVLDVIGKGAAQSWQMDNRGKTMVDGQFSFGFAVDWMRKDLGLLLDEAKRNGARLPVTALVDQFYADVQQMGGGRWDTSSLIARLEK